MTKDAVYIDTERRFNDLEAETKKLHDESKKYFEAVKGMLNHQIEFSKATAEVYNPISGRVSDPASLIADTNPEGLQACAEYEDICKELLETLQPELEMIETRVIRPADELIEVIKACKKVLIKRSHKQLDFDRHNATLKKLQDKKEKTIKDEKAMWKAEADVEAATQDYEYYNELLKTELPQLFALEREFIRPLFQSFYYMQLNVFYTLHERMQRIDIGYFDFTTEIEEGFTAKRGDIQQQVEGIPICRFKTTGRPRPVRPGPSRLAIEGRAHAPLAIESGSKPYSHKPSSSLSTISATDSATRRASNPPPPYSASASPMLGVPASNGVGRPVSTGANWGSEAKKKGAAPPPPKPKPKALMGVPLVETVTALYDYEAQTEGDLSFNAGDIIEIISRTDNENEWWQGRLNGLEGQFPGENLEAAPSQVTLLNRAQEITYSVAKYSAVLYSMIHQGSLTVSKITLDTMFKPS